MYTTYKGDTLVHEGTKFGTLARSLYDMRSFLFIPNTIPFQRVSKSTGTWDVSATTEYQASPMLQQEHTDYMGESNSEVYVEMHFKE